MSETSIASARASVMIYDDVNKKWVPSGSSSGLSKVHIFQHNCYNMFRVVGRKLHDHEVVINCIILRSLKYNQATDTFHQWRDNKQVYGLNFSSKIDADAFARAMTYAVENLANSSNKPNAPPLPVAATQVNNSPIVSSVVNNNAIHTNNTNNNNNSNNHHHHNVIQQQQNNGQYDEDMGYRNYYDSCSCNALSPDAVQTVYSNEIPSYIRTMTKEDMAVLQERRVSQQTQSSTSTAVSTLSSPGSISSSSAIISVSPQQQAQPPSISSSSSSSGHQRTSSAPPAPQPPPMTLCMPPPLQPSIPPTSIPPCPPPLPNTLPKAGLNNHESDQSSLATQLQSARLRRSNRQSTENSGSSTTSSGSGGSSNYGTLGRTNQSGMASMMDEMAKTLARRRAAVEKKEPSENSASEEHNNTADRKAWNNMNKTSTNGCESPKPNRKAFMTSSEELVSKVNGESNGLPMDLENFKQDILREVKKEINRMKQEIIDSIRQELGKR